jgi:adenylate kinase
MLGPPGSGKGTHGALLSTELGVPHVSSSDLLRQAVQRGTARHGHVRVRMAAGALVDDDVMIGLVVERLSRPDAQPGFVLDGFPRNVSQAAALDDWLAARGQHVDAVVLLEVPRDVLISRLAERAAVEGRDDDDATTIARRLEVYETETAPLVEYYDRRGVLRRVDADASIPVVAERILAALHIRPARLRARGTGTGRAGTRSRA